VSYPAPRRETQSKTELFSRPFLGSYRPAIARWPNRFACIVLSYPSRIQTPTTARHRRQKPLRHRDAFGTNGPGLCCRQGCIASSFWMRFSRWPQSFNWQTLSGLWPARSHWSRSGAPKKNYVGPISQPNARPSPALADRWKYGDTSLYEVFDHLHLFEHARCQSMRHRRRVVLRRPICCGNPGESSALFALTSRGPIVLMCSDLEMPR